MRGFVVATGALSGSGIVQLAVTILGGGGLLGSLVAILKLRPEANTQSVQQAQGAAAEWVKIATERERERDELRNERDALERQLALVREQLQRAEAECAALRLRLREARGR